MCKCSMEPRSQSRLSVVYLPLPFVSLHPCICSSVRDLTLLSSGITGRPIPLAFRVKKAQWVAAHLVLVALVNTQSLGTEAVSHTKVAHQVGQVDGPDAPGQLQLMQGVFKLPIV